MNLILFNLVLFGNLWIWKVFSVDPLIAILVVITSAYLYLFLVTKSKFHQKFFFVVLAILLFFQWKTTEIRSLTVLSNSDIRIRDMRLSEYPPVYVSIYEKTLWIPIAHWFEGRSEAIAFFRVLENLSEVIDPNLYFFANHPRQRVGYNEFEKFPYILLPFFVYGVFRLFEKRNKWQLMLVILAPVILISIIGNRSPLGPYSLFPFIVLSTSVGLSNVYEFVRSSKKLKSKYFIATFLVLYLLILVQIVSYEVY